MEFRRKTVIQFGTAGCLLIGFFLFTQVLLRNSSVAALAEVAFDAVATGAAHHRAMTSGLESLRG